VKVQPRPATAAKANTAKAGKGRKVVRKGRNARGRPKTTEELDADMEDYFQKDGKPTAEGDTAMANGSGAAQPVNGTDTGMDDEIMVSEENLNAVSNYLLTAGTVSVRGWL
jgi:THO complex subunit 4